LRFTSLLFKTLSVIRSTINHGDTFGKFAVCSHGPKVKAENSLAFDPSSPKLVETLVLTDLEQIENVRNAYLEK